MLTVNKIFHSVSPSIVPSEKLSPNFFHSFSLLLATVEFRSSMDGGIYAKEPSIKSSMVLPTKKSVTFPGDLQDTPAKPPLYHKQPPALPPKPFSRISNYSTGQLSVLISGILNTHYVGCFFFPKLLII